MDDSRRSRDHYAVLGVRPAASPEQITSAYRTLVRALHPDVRTGGPTADAELAEVIDAYRVLRDPLRRASYDAERDRGRQPAGRPGRIPVRVRSTSTTPRSSPRPPTASRPYDEGPYDTGPYGDPLDRLVAWLLYRVWPL